jgi:1-acyl-sn-glycerol-3-phosphate acyltransferase
MLLLRLVLFWCLWAVWTIFMGTAGLAGWPMLRGPRFTCIQRIWGRGTLQLLRHVVGLEYRLTGETHLLAAGQPILWASQHQSAWETVAFAALVPRLRFVIKRELLLIPFYGWYHRMARMIAVDRDGGMSALKEMVACVKDSLAEGYPVLIYPEGTRVPFGETRPLLPGVAALYTEVKMPVVPVVLDSGRVWPKGLWMRPGLVTVRILPPILPGLPRKAFQTQLAEQLQQPAVVAEHAARTEHHN